VRKLLGSVLCPACDAVDVVLVGHGV
jgi:hypothetical protein